MAIYGGLKEIAQPNHIYDVRRAMSRFIAGPGVTVATDFAVTGDPVALAVNIGPGEASVKLPGVLRDYEPFSSDAVEQRNLATAPGSGSRIDLVYLGVKDKQFGDTVNSDDIYVKSGTTNLGRGPDPDVMAGAYPIAAVTVPALATKGSQCTVAMLTGTTAPVRDGGYGGGDLNIPIPFFYEHHVTGVGSGGIMSAGTACPFLPRAIFTQPTNPIYYDPNIIGQIIIDRASIRLGSYKCQAWTVYGGLAATGRTIEYDALFVP